MISPVTSVSGFFDNSYRGCPGKDLCALRDWTCLCNITKFRKRWQDLGESPIHVRPHKPLRALQEPLPLYVPMIRHGSMREDVFQSPVVALSMFDVLRMFKSSRYGTRVPAAEELRVKFRLPQDAQILLVSVAKDRKLEAYWSNRNADKIPEALAGLSALGVTAPNYSSFIDAPSIHTTWNLLRMRKVTEELSAAGMAVVPHLNARTAANWGFWESLLTEQPSIRFVCKEFQTGLHKYDVGVRALGRIAELQRRVGRKLHPILVGGARFAEVAARCFEHFTIIDSTPFIKTVSRKRCVSLDGLRVGWKENFLPQNDRLDALLEHNHATYADALRNRVELAGSYAERSSQMELPLEIVH
ncbi:DUF4417 domain-containing protein [Melittangium boletus]|uniref:DUF4417 domain-containing protein n=1 Tax=Melittangium boletus TaxID=83453 RepID=UPI003DA624D7